MLCKFECVALADIGAKTIYYFIRLRLYYSFVSVKIEREEERVEKRGKKGFIWNCGVYDTFQCACVNSFFPPHFHSLTLLHSFQNGINIIM